MNYQLGDKFLVNEIECKIAYINNGMAWIVPLEGDTHIVIDRLDEFGYANNKTKAIAIVNKECLAV